MPGPIDAHDLPWLQPAHRRSAGDVIVTSAGALLRQIGLQRGRRPPAVSDALGGGGTGPPAGSSNGADRSRSWSTGRAIRRPRWPVRWPCWRRADSSIRSAARPSTRRWRRDGLPGPSDTTGTHGLSLRDFILHRPVPTTAASGIPTESCLLRPIRTVRAALPAPRSSRLATLLSSHRAITRVSLAALSFTFLIAFSQQAPPPRRVPEPRSRQLRESLLPQKRRRRPSRPMRRSPSHSTRRWTPPRSRTPAQVLPAQRVELAWNADRTELTVAPDQSVAGRRALPRRGRRHRPMTDGGERPARLRSASPSRPRRRRRSPTSRCTSPRPRRPMTAAPTWPMRAPPSSRRTAAPAARIPPWSSRSARAPRRSARRHRDRGRAPSARSRSGSASRWTVADVEAHFLDQSGRRRDARVEAATASSSRLASGSAPARATRSASSARTTRRATLLGGKSNFSFVVQPGAQLTKTSPTRDADDVEPRLRRDVVQPADGRRAQRTRPSRSSTPPPARRSAATSRGTRPATQSGSRRTRPFAGGRTFRVVLAEGARTPIGNAVDDRLVVHDQGATVARHGRVAERPLVDRDATRRRPAGRSGDEPGRLRAEPGQRRPRGLRVRAARPRCRHLGGRRVACLWTRPATATSATTVATAARARRASRAEA